MAPSAQWNERTRRLAEHGARPSCFFFFQAEDGIRDLTVTGVQTCALPISILVREYFGARIMGTALGAVAFVSTLGMALGPWAGGWVFDGFGNYAWLFIGSFGIGLGAVAIALTFRPPRTLSAALPSPLAAG